MPVAVAKDDIFFITEVMKSRWGDGLYGYIDRETGEVLTGIEGEPLEILPNEDSENFEVLQAEFDRRYLPIPQEGSGGSYQDMVNFINTVADDHLQDLLEVAIQGRGAFGRFKAVLRRPEYESDRSRWFQFSEQCDYTRVVEWLNREGLSVEA
ncbi:MAG: UPF0158 family protein [Cyanobacteria bacterium P01_D01_bin.71]